MITATIKQCRLVTIKYMPTYNDCKCSVQESAKRLRDTSQVAGTFKIKNLNQDPDTRCWILKCARPRCARSLFQGGISLLETSELIRHCCRPLLRAPSHNRPKLNKAVYISQSWEQRKHPSGAGAPVVSKSLNAFNRFALLFFYFKS